MANDAYKAGEGALWVQPDGPNTQPQYLGCHMVGDIAEPRGDVTLLFCPDESRVGKFKATGSFQGAPGPVTTTITTKVQKVADYLEQVSCGSAVFLAKAKCGRRDVFTNYERMYILQSAIITNATLTAMLAMTPDDEGESQQAFDFSSLGLLRVMAVSALRQSTADTEGINDVVFVSDTSCASDCGGAQGPCLKGFYAGKALAASAANQADVYKTLDGGGVWAATATKPFLGGMDIAALKYFPYGASTSRLLAGNGTTQASAPAQASYSDDDGATWTRVNVGSTNAQYFLSPRAIYAESRYNIWAVTSGGYIYVSRDGGATWTTKDAGIAAGSANLHAVHFYDAMRGAAAGATGTILKTIDAGTTWSAVTGPAAESANIVNTIRMASLNRVWVGYSSGKIYYTSNFQSSAPTWYERVLPIVATGIKDIRFANESVGYLIATITGPAGRVLRTLDGGYTWEDIPVPTNAGLNGLSVCGINTAFAVGDASGGTGVILKVG